MSRLPFWPGKPDPDDIPHPDSEEISGLDSESLRRFSRRERRRPEVAAELPAAEEYEPAHTGGPDCPCAVCRQGAASRTKLDTQVSTG